MVRIAILGSGFGRYGHLPAFARTPGCKVVAIYGQKSQILMDAAKKFDVRVYDDLHELLEKEDLNAVSVALRPREQYKAVKAALSRELHVFAEKPLALNVKEARELLALARKKRVIHAVDFIFPELPAWQAAKTLLKKKTYGELRHITVHWEFLSYDIKHGKRTWKTDAKEGGGALSFYFSHGLYNIEWLAGKMHGIKSNFTDAKESLGGAEVGVDMLFKCPNAVTGSARVSCNTRGVHRHEVRLECSRGTMVLANSGSHVEGFTLTAFKDGAHKVVPKKELSRVGHEDPRAPLVRALAKRFVKSCKTGEQMSPSFVDGLRVQELISAVRKADGA